MVPTRILQALPALFLAGLLVALESYAKEVILTTGRIQLRPISSAEVAAAVAAASESGASAGQGLEARLGSSSRSSRSSSTGARAAAAPGPPTALASMRSRRLFIMSYKDEAHAKRIAKGLVTRQALVLSYIPDKNFLVSAAPDVALRVAYEQGAEAAECDSSLKVSPDWQQLLQAPPTGGPSPSDGGGSGGAADPASADQAAAEALLNSLQLLPPPAGGSGAGGQFRYGILVELQSGVSQAAAALAAAEQDWPTDLAAALEAARGGGSSTNRRAAAACRPAVVGPGGGAVVAADVLRFSVFLCRQDLADGVRWLAALPEVKWVAPLRGARSHNALSSILLQTGDLTVEQYDDPAASNTTRRVVSHRPYWDAGLQGQGEIIGVGDTGLDVDSCYFDDPRYSGSYAAALADESSAPRLQGLPYARIPEHRKVVQYAIMKAGAYTGDALDRNGHGTSVSGCVAGAVLAGDDAEGATLLDDATGAAPQARISLVDLSNDNTDNMVLPVDLAGGYMAIHRAAGAAVHSNSWGWSQSTYTYSRDFDKFLWENPIAISINSVGNEGARAVRRVSVNEPSLAKNVVAVGAGTRMAADMVGNSFLMYKISAVWRNGRVDDTMFYPAEIRRLPLLGDAIPDGGKLRMVLADPLGACRSLRRLRLTPKGAVVMVTAATTAQTCSSFTQARRVVEAGGAAMLVIQTDNVQPRTPRDPVDPESGQLLTLLPVSGVNWEWGQYLMAVANNESLVELTISKSWGLFDSNVIPSFSSAGPMPDGRIKPDIVAPGFSITSASKSATYPSRGGTPDASSPPPNTCTVVEQQMGTSFSAPMVAGNIAIMRQYLRSGFYPTGSPDNDTQAPFTPSGMLLKALMIAGAKSLEGGLAMLKGGPMGPAPDGFQGWGRLSLAGSLPLPGFTDPRVRLQLADWGAFTTAGDSTTIGGLVATGTGPVTAVMSYYDYPGDTLAGGVTVNNLDLVVELEAPGGWVKRVLGNQDENAVGARPDKVNTVERVLLTALPEGTALRLIVNAASLPSTVMDPLTPQRWAVVVVGHFEGTMESPLNPAWAAKEGLAEPPTFPGAPPPPPPRSPPAPRKPPRPKKRPPPSVPLFQP